MTVPKELNFDSPANAERGARVAFVLGGREWHCKSGLELPLNLLKAPEAVEYDMATPEGQAASSAALFEMVKTRMCGLLVEGEVADFVALMESPQSPVTMGNGMSLVVQLIEAIGKRPTPRSTSSRVGPRTTKLKSVGASSSRATRKTG